MIDVPNGSIYFEMYKWGLKHVDQEEIATACACAGKEIRKKDWDNYWNGYHNSDLYHGPGADDIFMLSRAKVSMLPEFFTSTLYGYDMHPYIGLPEVNNRWVPCSKDNKPMIKWGQGCMDLADAVAYKDQVYLAENLKGTRFIVIDCDGDHGDELDLETIYFLNRWRGLTHCLTKPTDSEIPVSFHLTFKVSHIIPTMHFPYAHIDIVGNQRNSLRYWKNKKWNGIEPAYMHPGMWEELKQYIKYRKEKADGRNESAGYAAS